MFFRSLPFHNLLKGVVIKRYFVGKIGSNPTPPAKNYNRGMRLLLSYYPFKTYLNDAVAKSSFGKQPHKLMGSNPGLLTFIAHSIF